MSEIHISLASPLLALQGGWEAGTMNLHTYTMDNTKLHPSASTRKRVRSDRSTSDDERLDYSENDEQNKNWPRFIVLEAVDSERPLTKLSPFAVAKTVQGKYGTVKVTKMKTGSLLLEAARSTQAKQILETKTFLGVEVKASPHRYLNTSKGVIRDYQRDLFDLSEEEIADELSSQGVTQVSRFILKKDGKEIKTNTLFVTFGSPTPPSQLVLGYYIVKVQLYVPNPLRCFQCQEFGHSRKFCKKDNVVCWKCGNEGHDGVDCRSGTTCCVNCKGNHCSSSKSCPVWIREKEIQRVKTEKSLSYNDAKRVVTSSSTSSATSYASVVKGPSATVSVECQTPAFWIKNLPPLNESRKLPSSDTRTTATITDKTSTATTDETSTLDSRKKPSTSPIKSKPAFNKYDKNIEELTKEIEEEIGQKYPVYPDEDPPAHFESEDDMEVTPVFRPQRQRSRTRGRKNISPVTYRK